MSGISLDSISGSVTPQIGQEQNKLNDMLNNVDVSDPVSMVKMQMEYSRYNMEVGFMSSMVKDLKDSVSQILQRM
jgi:type III secretion apparatus needle protein